MVKHSVSLSVMVWVGLVASLMAQSKPNIIFILADDLG